MRSHMIEIDEDIWNHLKSFAEPFVDTPNSVLRRLLLTREPGEPEVEPANSMIQIKGIPKSLSQIFEVIYEIEANGCSRMEATHRVAKKRGTASQTIVDKYCRQLNRRASEIDRLFDEPGYPNFQTLLKENFGQHQYIIDLYFETLLKAENLGETVEPALEMDELVKPLA